MPTKHISEKAWRTVEKEIVRAVTTTKRSFKESDVIEMLIKKGAENMTENDYIEAMKNKKK